MDTRFWGPSGWKLLHTMTFLYPQSPTEIEKTNMREFLLTLPYILPCKYCRYSLTCYYEKDPPVESLGSRSHLTRWLWRIHNQVNNKLRSQNLNPGPNPSFESVKTFYRKWLKNPEDYSCYLPTFWNFLFSVAYNHPKQTHRDSKPMPDCPEAALKCKNLSERNKWNILPYSVRLAWYKRFWKLLPNVLGDTLSKAWKEAMTDTGYSQTDILKNRRTMLAWLWRMRCRLDSEFQDPYTQVCEKIKNYSSNCSKSVRGKTCRRARNIERNISRKASKTE